MSETWRGRRAAHCADRLDAQKPGERTGSRPKPPVAGARAPALSPADHRATAKLHSCFSAAPRLASRGKQGARRRAANQRAHSRNCQCDKCVEDRQRDFTRPCRRVVSRCWSGNSRQLGEVEETGVSAKAESPKGTRIRLAWKSRRGPLVRPNTDGASVRIAWGYFWRAVRDEGRAGYRKRLTAARSRTSRRGKERAATLSRASISKPRARCRSECPDELSRARLYPSMPGAAPKG
jgi:hypothetical protein